MKIKFIPLDYDYEYVGNKTYIKIFGKNDEGERFCVIDELKNFFYFIPKDLLLSNKIIEQIKKIEGIEKIEIVEKKYLENPVKAIKIYCNYNRMQDVAHKIEAIGETREKDINQITRYIIEKGIKPLVWYEIEADVKDDLTKLKLAEFKEGRVVRIIKSNELKEHKDFIPKVLAFDIEAEEFEIGAGRILMISLVSERFKKVITWKKVKEASEYVEFVDNEAELIKKFVYYVNKINPDIITGYFSDGFDLPYLRIRAEKNGIDLRLGFANSKILFSKGRLMNAKISGLVHIDLFKFIETVYSQYLQSETLSLNDVAKELIGEEKLSHEHKKIHGIKEEEWHQFFEYNLHDSVLAYKLFQKLWPDMVEFTKIVQEPLFTITRQSMSGLVESYIIHNLKRFNEIAEKRPTYNEIEERKRRERYEGAFVLQPKPNLYENLAIFDFTSMYASIIVSFNLSKPTLLKQKEGECLEVDLGRSGKVYFSKKKGFIPILLEEIIKIRKKYKEELKKKPDPIKKARSNAFKLLANAFYGYNGFFGARYYCPEAAASTAALARKFIKEMIEKTNKEGYEVIYADTDGFAFLLKAKTKEETLKFLQKINKELPGVMELELEDFYKRGIWVAKRTREIGAKKKYALINWEGKMKIRGFETVRRDWCNLAREVQNKVLEIILKEGSIKSALEYVREVIDKLKKRKIEKKELIIKTQLKKPIKEYVAESPHVAVAKKMKKLGLPVNVGMLIQYYVAESTKSRIRDKAKLPEEEGEYDINYYIERQIIPAVENIFEIFGLGKKEIVSREQRKLDSFM